ncbi:MAG: glycoside hydrolase family 5 protein [Solirubrobacteraceae bacterium]
MCSSAAVWRLLVAVVALGALLTAAALGGARPAPTGMSISGGTLYKGGHRFLVRGFSMEAAVTPRWCSSYPWGVTARHHDRAGELNAYVHRWHANTLRFQVSQEGLGDTARRSSAQIAAYLREIKHEVATARRAGLVVILAMQDQFPRSCGEQYELPNAQTVAAWKTLSAEFRHDPYVIFELYNEPEAGGTDAEWKQWAHGGRRPLANRGRTHTSTKAVGEQQLVRDLRSWGANNVILVDGGDWAEHLNGTRSYPIHDVGSGRGVGYAVHPYRFTQGEAEWQSAYGFAANRGRLVVATEWSYGRDKCSGRAPGLTPRFLRYLKKHRIGMTAYAGDVMHHTVADWNYDPTNCHGRTIGGSGAQTMAWFAHLAGK